MSFAETLWSVVIVFLFLSYLVVLFQIVADLIRDGNLSGWIKALWTLLLIVLPVIAALVYLVVRGRGMAVRQLNRATESENTAEAHLRSSAALPTPVQQIGDAKALLDNGSITAEEFAVLKAKALA